MTHEGYDEEADAQSRIAAYLSMAAAAALTFKTFWPEWNGDKALERQAAHEKSAEKQTSAYQEELLLDLKNFLADNQLR